jgi:RimJ/RimL family protein N-acetyltransferase
MFVETQYLASLQDNITIFSRQSFTDMQLQGTGFILRGWKHGDEIALQKNADNPKIAACLWDRFPSPYTPDDAVAWVNRKVLQNPILNFALDIEGEVAGAIGLELKEDVYYRTASIGYWLGEQFWGRGIMPEALKLVTDYGFNNFDFIRIQAGVYSKNPRSMRVLEKAGYHKECIMKKSVVKDAEVLDEHVYVIFR